MSIAYLPDRGVVRVTGEDAKGFLDGLLTCDLDRVAAGRARYGGLLTPQGKILFDFVVFQDEGPNGGYHFDCASTHAADLARRLGFYKLRARTAVEDLSATMAVIVGWGDSPRPTAGLVADDPRLSDLGWRALVPTGEAPAASSVAADVYHAHRIALGVPEGGKDFSLGEAFPHEALMDQLQGIDFDKGCYVGQEVVSRMQHRGTARTRVVSVIYPDGARAPAGSSVTADERVIGTTGTGADGRGLAMVRLDRAADALAAGTPILAGGIPVRLDKPAWIKFPFPGEAAATPAA